MVAHVQAPTQAPARPAAVQDLVGFPVGFCLCLTCELSTADALSTKEGWPEGKDLFLLNSRLTLTFFERSALGRLIKTNNNLKKKKKMALRGKRPKLTELAAFSGTIDQ